MTTDIIPSTKTTAPAKPAPKSTAIIKLLTRARGATVSEIQLATGWQPHSVRAFLSGQRKAGRILDKEERKSGETSYRFASAPIVGAVTGVEEPTVGGVALESAV